MMSNRLAPIQQFIRNLVTAAASAQLYSPDHQQVSRLAALSLANLHDAMGNDLEISLMIIDSDLIVDSKMVDRSLYISKFVQALQGLGITHLKLVRGITQEELLALVCILIKHKGGPESISPTEHIHFGTVAVRFSETETAGHEVKKETLDLHELAAAEAARFAEIYEEVRRHKRLRVNGIFDIVSSFINAFKQLADPLMALASLRALDEYTFTHSTNVCILNIAQATALGIAGALLQEIGISAMLHDIGKLFIPEEILTKPGGLTDEEWSLMRQHPVKGAQYLLDAPGVPRLAVVTAFEHHLKHDLTGYPAVAPTWRLNLCSQLTTISDVFDAMRTRRSYKDPLQMEPIIARMTELMGTALQPELTANFINIMMRANAPQSSR